MSKAYDAVANQILSLLDQGVAPWRQTWTGGGEHRSVHGHTYRGWNAFWTALVATNRGYTSRTWITFNQAKERGGSVRKGEKGTVVVQWKIVRSSEDGAEASADGRTFMVPFYYTVFNLDQVDGVPEPVHKEREHAEIPSADEIVSGYANGPRVEFGGERAYYRPSADLVRCPERSAFESSEAFYATLFHELVHSTGAESRLSRSGVTNIQGFGSHSYGQEELVAEFGAAFLCNEAGIAPATIENSAAYLQAWRDRIKAEPRIVLLAVQQAQKAADHIRGRKAPEYTRTEETRAA